MRRVNSRDWCSLTFAQQSRWCHLADLFGVDDNSEDDPHAMSEADYIERKANQAQDSANADAAALYGR